MEGYFNNLYKYVSYETAKIIIEKQTLRFSKPKRFNDPLDCYEGLIGVDEECIFKFAQDKFKYADRSYRIQMYDLAMKNLKLQRQNIRELFYKERDRILITCFSKSCEKLLMWSHYTDSHKGICFEFFIDKQTGFEKFGKILPLPVIYKTLQEKIKFKHNFTDALIKWVTLKSDKWIDEDEVRWILMDQDVKEDFIDISFSKCLLKKVIFGYNVTPVQRKEIVNLVQENFKDCGVKFSVMGIDEKIFDIREVPYDIQRIEY